MKLKFFIKQYIKMFVQFIILPLVYNIYSKRPVKENLIIFADAHNDKLPYSMEEIYKHLSFSDYQLEEFFIDYQKNSYLKVIIEMIKFMKTYSIAKYVFICDNFLPVASCNKREDTVVIQLWHAGGILKKFGYDTNDDIPKYYKGNVFKNYNIVTVSSKLCVDVYESAMKLQPGVVKPIGLSRTDRFFSKEYKRECFKIFYETYPEAIGKKVILWAPTFRGKASDPYVIGEDYIKSLSEKLGDEWYVITKLHPHIKNESIYNCNIDTDKLLIVIDVLISDYSSVIFDYILLEKPLVLFAPDYKQYEMLRGLYISYESIPGRIVTKGEDLSKQVLEEYGSFNCEKMKDFTKRYMGSCDGNSTVRLLKLLL